MFFKIKKALDFSSFNFSISHTLWLYIYRAKNGKKIQKKASAKHSWRRGSCAAAAAAAAAILVLISSSSSSCGCCCCCFCCGGESEEEEEEAPSFFG
jgi:hypothetical protein